MQTFLPYADFAKSAAALDRQRLGKQRVENLQIMKTLLTGQGWVNHPATRQWQGYELALLDYQLAICDEWSVVRGYKDTCADKTIELVQQHLPRNDVMTFFMYGFYDKPTWLGHRPYHKSHQSNLLRKDQEFYGPQFPGVPADLNYVWPARKVS